MYKRQMYGLTGAAQADDNGIYPMETANGIKVMSINLLLPTEDTPVIWRGPVLANMVKQFWTDVVWEDVYKRQPLDDSQEKEANDYIVHRFVHENK